MHSALGGDYKGLTGDAAGNIRQGDDFLSQIIPIIMASNAYMNRGVIIIWWDESESDGVADDNADDLNHTIPEIIISPRAHRNVKGLPYASTLAYNHSSDLRTMQEIFHIAPFLGDAANASDLSDLFESRRHRSRKNSVRFLPHNLSEISFFSIEIDLGEIRATRGTTLPSGLQYKIITAGTGAKSTTKDAVTCNYLGTLINVSDFDSSYKRGQPTSFPVNGVIKGWTRGAAIDARGVEVAAFHSDRSGLWSGRRPRRHRPQCYVDF